MPHCFLQTVFRWSKFRNGLVTAISAPRQIFTRIWITHPRFLPHRQWRKGCCFLRPKALKAAGLIPKPRTPAKWVRIMRHKRRKRQFYPKMSQFYPKFSPACKTIVNRKLRKTSKKCKKRLENVVFSSQIGGDGGIRTHGRLPVNWFRVSPVMTTSIRLHVCSPDFLPQKLLLKGKTLG